MDMVLQEPLDSRPELSEGHKEAKSLRLEIGCTWDSVGTNAEPTWQAPGLLSNTLPETKQ